MKKAIVAAVISFASASVSLRASEAGRPAPTPTRTSREASGLQLSVMEESVRPGDSIDLHWEIVPDGPRSVSIILGILLPDESVRYYSGPEEGFTKVDEISKAARIVSDFPFNTRMKGTIEIRIPADWPAGTYQFMANVCDGKTCLEIVYSNAFEVE